MPKTQDPGIAMTRSVHGRVQSTSKRVGDKKSIGTLIKWPWPPIVWKCPLNVAACAPPYEPAMWNFVPRKAI